MRGTMDHHHHQQQQSRTTSGHTHCATVPSTTIITRHLSTDGGGGGVASEPHLHLARRDSIPESKDEEQKTQDMYSFVVDDPEKAYAQFMQAHRCYDVIPMNAKLVILDTNLDVSKAFYALVYNSVRSALLWHPTKQRLCGMLTITDFILILLRLYRTEKATIGTNLETHLIGEWRDMLKKEGKLKKLTTVSANTSLYRAVQMLSETMYHRIPVLDEVTGNPLYFLTHKRILRFLYLYLEQLPRPSFMHESVQQLGVGTYNDLQYVHPETPLVECLAKLTSRHMSAVPVVERDTLQVVDIYARFDAIGLAAQQSYDNLDKTVAVALQHRKLSNWYEGVLTCLETDTLWEVVKKLVMHEVHGLVVVNSKNVLRGVLTLSDVLRYMVLMPIMEKTDSVEEINL
jgi:5'-AMP-activated protein kinase regulatory gamma subunit